jgi:arsenate reductase
MNPSADATGTTPKIRVLFLCTHNSVRSQMAEGLLREVGGARFEVYSAGSEPAPQIHPLAVQTMGRMGIDISQQQPKQLSQLSQQVFDYVITVCDHTHELCPTFVDAPEQIYWTHPDPTMFDSEPNAAMLFDSVATSLLMQICLYWKLALPTQRLLVN